MENVPLRKIIYQIISEYELNISNLENRLNCAKID